MKDPYSGRSDEVFQVAASLYRGGLGNDGELDYQDPRSIVNPSVGGTPQEQHRNVARAYELTISARVLARTALDLDKLNRPGIFNKATASVELLGRLVTEPFEMGRIIKSGLLDRLRLPNQVDNLRKDLKK